MIWFLVDKENAFGMEDFLADRGAPLAGRIRVLPYQDLPGRTTVPSGTWVLSDLDRLSPRGLALVTALQEQLTAAGCRILNRAGSTLLRYDLLAALHQQGFNRHGVRRATGSMEGLRFPVFLRQEHQHNGAVSELLSSPRQLEGALALALSRGHRLSELLIVEYLDTADAAGFYRKYAAFVVGTRVVARGLAYGRDWMLKHRGTEFSDAMLEEEYQYVRSNPHRAELERVARLAGVEYGRIDYAMRPDGPEIWEINLNPTIGRGRGTEGGMPPEYRAAREPTRLLWGGGLIAAFEAVDAETGGSEIPVVLPAVSSGEMGRRDDPDTRWPRVRALLRPARPALGRLVSAVSPLLIRLARRKR